MRATVLAMLGSLLAIGAAGGVMAAEPAASQSAPRQDMPNERIDASRAVVNDFATRLKGALVQSIERDGPIGAVEVCHTLAPQIAESASRETGWRVGRTSLMTRNVDNRPDAWEQSVLAMFAARKAAGQDPSKMESWAITEDNGQKSFRYMKAIPTASVCLTCHGSDIDPALRARIDALYPEDRATGYREGDIRGAFTVTQPM